MPTLGKGADIENLASPVGSGVNVSAAQRDRDRIRIPFLQTERRTHRRHARGRHLFRRHHAFLRISLKTSPKSEWRLPCKLSYGNCSALIEELAPNSFTIVVVNALTAQTLPSRSMTLSL